MPKRTDIQKIMIIGSGPIVIGQACEFDYSGVQACKALKEEGYTIVLVNSNPATIMTDPDFAHHTYVEPLTTEMLTRIIEAERPQALLPTLGGQTGLNLAVALYEQGVLEKYGMELIGASYQAIKKAEDRFEFKAAMQAINLEVPKSGYVSSPEEAKEIIREIGFPAIIRPSFTLGGAGGSVAYNLEEYEAAVRWGLDLSPVRRILIEESVLGWKEYELEVMRDFKDNVVIVCSIENFDPMGIHTGDSVTVAPAQTLSDKEYQLMRDASLAIMREIGVDTGGSNIQFGIHPENGRMVIIEMNPRVSRSSSLASKATGFPIAKIAAKLAVGYTLDEIPNDITRKTPACFEPTIDYVVTKIPRFTFEKFPKADDTLSTQMKSVGEVMAIGRTFKESFLKAISSLELDLKGLDFPPPGREPIPDGDLHDYLRAKLYRPNSFRYLYVAEALRRNFSPEEIFQLTAIDPWFIDQLHQILEMETRLKDNRELMLNADDPEAARLFRQAKEYGFGNLFLARIWGVSEQAVRELAARFQVRAVFKRVDTCAAEFEAFTPYLYSTYESECEADPTDRRKIMILGGGPNRIGQGIEFDYCCVHGAFALKEDGFETIMVNCNPETVSTDYDTSDRLYFEPLTLEHVLNIVHREKPEGVIVQFGGQTPLKLAVPLEKAGVRIIGTSPDAIDRAEDRERFRALLNKLELKQAESETVFSLAEALRVAQKIGYPVMVRPSYVLGGRAMRIVYSEENLRTYMREAVQVSHKHPILVDKFLNDAIEVDVDAICDGRLAVVGGIMEHIEEAGVHSGDSACSLPPFSLAPDIVAEIRRQTLLLARELNVIGLMNIQFAVKSREVYVLEVNPRASRTVPFVSKAIGVPLAKLAARVMAGKTLTELGFTQEVIPRHISVKEAVFPFLKFPGVDTLLGPEMKSTGEVMGIDLEFGRAYYKAQISAGNTLPKQGRIFISVKDDDKEAIYPIAREFAGLGFELIATRGTAEFLIQRGIAAARVYKVQEGRPHIVDKIKSGEIDLVINSSVGEKSIADSYSIRRTTLERGVPYFTSVEAALAALAAVKSGGPENFTVRSLQTYHALIRG